MCLVHINDDVFDWQAKWIAPPGSRNVRNCFFRAVKTFTLGALPESALLRIGAESRYLLYVNGVELGLGPVRGNANRNYYDCYDCAALLRPGENCIAVLVHCMNIETFIAAPSQPGFILEIPGVVITDDTWRTRLANDWKQDVQIYSIQVGFCEWRDMRDEPSGWTLGNCRADWDHAWEIPRENGIYGKALLSRDIPALARTVCFPEDIPAKAAVPPLIDPEDIKIAKIITEEAHLPLPEQQIENLPGLLEPCGMPTRVLPAPDGGGTMLILDFCKEVIGHFELDVTAPSGTIIDICHEEELYHGRIRADQPRDFYNFADRYILREGRQKIGNFIEERGFRMVQLVFRNFSSPVTIHRARAIDARYPFAHGGAFFCSDNLLNRIWDACCETISACTTDVFTDCPWRERSFWVNDLIVENKTSLAAFGASPVHRRAFRLAFSQARDNGFLPGVCPFRSDNGQSIISVNLFMPLMLKDYLFFSGDAAFVKEHLPALVKIMETFHEWENEDGLLIPPGAPARYWNFFDWSYEINSRSLDGKNTSLLNYLYITALKTFLELAKLTGFKLEEEKYRRRLDRTAENVERVFFRTGNNQLTDWVEDGRQSECSSQLAHAFAMLSGEGSESNRKYFAQALGNHDLLMPELYLHYFVFQALRMAGMENEALNRIKRYWGDIVLTGSPTIWEAGIHKKGKPAFYESGSLCHGFSTSPIDFFQSTIIGIYPVEPGFAKFIVDPKSMGLESAQGRVPTPHGNIFISWTARNNILNIQLRVPDGTAALTRDGQTYAPGIHNFTLTGRTVS